MKQQPKSLERVLLPMVTLQKRIMHAVSTLDIIRLTEL